MVDEFTLSLEEVRAVLHRGEPVAFLHARTPDVWIGAGDDFERLPAEVTSHADALLPHRWVIVVGDEEAAALYARTLRQHGVSNALALAGGEDAWRAAGVHAVSPDPLYPSVW